MPPRYVYWTILIDNKPTAFRAQDREELLPTLTQLRRTNQDVVMKYFAHGRVWDSQEQARESRGNLAAREKRGRDWRPGGSHEDPRARFDKNKRDHKTPGVPPVKSADTKAAPSDRHPQRPPPQGEGPWQKERPRGPGGPKTGARPWTPKPTGERRPWQNKATAPAGERRPWQNKPTAPAGERRPWRDKPARGTQGKAGSRPKQTGKKPKPPEDE